MTRRWRLLRVTTLAGRARGLLFRRRLRLGLGLWLIPCCAIHTVGMRYDIDVVFLDRQGRVLKRVRKLKPWRLVLCLGAVSAVEFQGGSIDVEHGGIGGIETTIQNATRGDIKRNLQNTDHFVGQTHGAQNTGA